MNHTIIFRISKTTSIYYGSASAWFSIGLIIPNNHCWYICEHLHGSQTTESDSGEQTNSYRISPFASSHICLHLDRKDASGALIERILKSELLNRVSRNRHYHCLTAIAPTYKVRSRFIPFLKWAGEREKEIGRGASYYDYRDQTDSRPRAVPGP